MHEDIYVCVECQCTCEYIYTFRWPLMAIVDIHIYIYVYIYIYIYSDGLCRRHPPVQIRICLEDPVTAAPAPKFLLLGVLSEI